ncbi:pyridoxal 4-dehydrogenase [Sphingomonas deserti]|uniref:Pyridoxal 4-dehydrogenase n=2 Tax=Allosphingosinicella deserti TaxID=2116704 RepID=A0A2P7R087_9SPHN|nr:aldo/keto reductase [Sphingomonas deserti]PSJ43630.1 pyridoxal 4-dehydrogenase [Sphingomonas deserti]
MGCAGIGNLYAPVSDCEAHDTVAAAWQAGIRYFDTAPHYGFGLSECRLGAALAAIDSKREAIVSTKVGRLLDPIEGCGGERHGFVDAAAFEPRFDYRGDAILRSVEESCARLRRDRIDILLAHDLGALTHGAAGDRHLRDFLDSGYPAMRALRDQGAVRALGLGVNETAICLDLLARVELDVILLAGRFTLLDQSALDRLLPRCLEKGTRLIVGGPYNSGILAQSTRTVRDLRYDYRAPPETILLRAAAIEQICDDHHVPLPAAALRFPLRHPAVASVIPGLVGEKQVEEMMERLALLIPDALWTALHEADLVRITEPEAVALP